MILRLLLALAVLYAGFRFVQWLRKQPRPRQIQAGLVAGTLVLLVLVATGRAPWLLALLGAVAAIGMRLVSLLRFIPPNLLMKVVQRLRDQLGLGGGATGSGRVSAIETVFFTMRLDHETGELDGVVSRGAFAGRRLNELGLEQLRELLHTCRTQDAEGARLLESYLDRVHGAGWRRTEDGTAEEGTSQGNPSGPLSPEEAYQILGLENGASREAIIAAHRRLIQKLHPDRGGSTFLAAKINQAKAVLIGE